MKKYYELDEIDVGSTVVMDDGKWLRVDEVEGVKFWGTDPRRTTWEVPPRKHCTG